MSCFLRAPLPNWQRLKTYPIDFFKQQLGTVPAQVLGKHRCSLALGVGGQFSTEEGAIGGLSNQRQPKAWRPGDSKAQKLSSVNDVGFTFTSKRKEKSKHLSDGILVGYIKPYLSSYHLTLEIYMTS